VFWWPKPYLKVEVELIDEQGGGKIPPFSARAFPAMTPRRAMVTTMRTNIFRIDQASLN
jgi:hypothetical protein